MTLTGVEDIEYRFLLGSNASFESVSLSIIKDNSNTKDSVIYIKK